MGSCFTASYQWRSFVCVMKDGAHNMERTKNGILLKQFPQWTSSGLIWNFNAVIVMASGLLGRLAGISRTFIAGLHTELQFKTRPKEPLHLVTGSAGFSKTISQSPSFKQWTFGDDAYFVANNRTADVIGLKISVLFWFLLDLLNILFVFVLSIITDFCRWVVSCFYVFKIEIGKTVTFSIGYILMFIQTLMFTNIHSNFLCACFM